MGILVVMIAVIIMISKGITEILTAKPISTKNPQAISKDATNTARNSGLANPIGIFRMLRFFLIDFIKA